MDTHKRKVAPQDNLETCCKLYDVISKWSWPKKFSHKILLIAFLATHIPLIAFASYIFIFYKTPDINWVPLILILIGTLIGTAMTLLAIQSLLAPIHLVSQSLTQFAKNREITPLPRHHNDEIGHLMRDTADTLDQLNLAIEQLNQQRQQTEFSLQKAINENEELDRISKIDPLTGLANRRYLDEYLESQFSWCASNNQNFSLMIMDLDEFKAFNDIAGHLAGDTCLRKIGQFLNTFPNRAHDFAARFGGEEFCIVLPDTDQQTALEMAEELRSSISNLRIKHPLSKDIFVTASIGVSSAIASKQNTIDQLLNKADKALYKAKNSGRNRVAFLA